MTTETTISKTDKRIAAVKLGEDAWAPVWREYGSWRASGKGAGGGIWIHESLDRLAKDLTYEHRAFGHILTFPSAREAIESIGG